VVFWLDGQQVEKKVELRAANGNSGAVNVTKFPLQRS
jgi:hypothetical protein